MTVAGFKSMSRFALTVSFRKSYSSSIGYSNSLQRFFTSCRQSQGVTVSESRNNYTSIFASSISKACTFSSSSSISSVIEVNISQQRIRLAYLLTSIYTHDRCEELSVHRSTSSRTIRLATCSFLFLLFGLLGTGDHKVALYRCLGRGEG